MTRSRSLFIYFALAFFTAAATPLSAAHPVGTPSGGGASIQWQLAVTGHESIELTVVTPDGEPYSKTITAGRNVSFSLSEIGDAQDGAYAYELRVVPRIAPDVRNRLAQARAKNDDAAIRKIRRDARIGEPLTESGTFVVRNGSIVSPDAVEPSAHDGAANATSGGATSNAVQGAWTPTTNDQVTADDLIVQGSACVGLDCVANESFGFDTIRLKENNTRIKFEDTSSTSGFPTNDWQLSANNNASGGASNFTIEDIDGAKTPFTVTAGAPTSSFFMSSIGKVGFRTATPVLDLHMTTSDTPAIRFEQTNAGGFTAQTWDIGANEANFFVRDVTGGSRLPFRIRPGAPTSSIDINAIGDVGIGTADPKVRLHVIGDVEKGSLIRVQNLNAIGYGGLSFMDKDGGARMFIGVDNSLLTSRIASFSTSPLVLVTSNIERARITPAGFLGIGTTAPSSMLHVNGGDIRVSGGSFIDDGTTLSVPDYVFDNSYQLMSLPEVATFVRENRHLPDVPAEADVKAKGLNMSDFQMRLLRKVEELTLYAIDQHEQAESLSAAKSEQQQVIAGLQAENAEMRARLARIEEMLAAQKQ